MRSLHHIALFVGLAAMVGCGDDPDASLNGVFPSSGFIGRKLRVEVSADNASFVDGQVQLDFGPDVTVSSLEVASPTALFAELTIADTASVGARDVIVKQGAETLKLSQAFMLESPVAVEFSGNLAQGSVVAFTATNLDLTHLYDTTCGASLFGICLRYVGMQVVTPPGVTAVVGAVEPFRVSGTLYVDLDAQSGEIRFVSGPADDAAKQVTSAMGVVTEFAARAPVPLTAGTPTTTTVSQAFDSHLYSFDAAATSAATFSVSPGDSDASPTVFVLPESGHFADLLAASENPSAIAESAGKLYAIYSDSSGLSGYSYAIRVKAVQLIAAAENDAGNNTSANAQDFATNSTILVTNATLASINDDDWYRFTVPANSAAKKVHVLTGGSDPMTDTVIDIYADAEAPNNMIGQSSDDGYLDEVVSSAIGNANVIFVRIYGSPGYFDPAHNQYIAAIWLE